MLAVGDMHPAYIQKAARHKHAESSVTYIEASLSKALKANDLLSGNNPSEGWGSHYSGDPRSLSHFLPEKCIKKLPPQAESSLKQGHSKNSTTSTNTSGSSLLGDSSNRKQTNISDQVKVCDRRVQSKDTSAVADTSANSTPSRPTLNLAALEALQINGAIQVVFPRILQENNVKFPTPPSKK